MYRFRSLILLSVTDCQTTYSTFNHNISLFTDKVSSIQSYKLYKLTSRKIYSFTHPLLTTLKNGVPCDLIATLNVIYNNIKDISG